MFTRSLRGAAMTLASALLCLASAVNLNSSKFRQPSEHEREDVRSMLYADGPREISLTSLYPESEKVLQSFHRAITAGQAKEADRVVESLHGDFKEYLAAYRDYSQTSVSDFVQSARRKVATHTYVYELTAIKILCSAKDHPHVNLKLGSLFRDIQGNSESSGLACILTAEDTLNCGEHGLEKARGLYARCETWFPHVSSVCNREAYLLESTAGYREPKPGESADQMTLVVIRPDVRRAVQIRSRMVHTFPDFASNYFSLAMDHIQLGDNPRARQILTDFLKRFSRTNPFYFRCKSLLKSLS